MADGAFSGGPAGHNCMSLFRSTPPGFVVFGEKCRALRQVVYCSDLTLCSTVPMPPKRRKCNSVSSTHDEAPSKDATLLQAAAEDFDVLDPAKAISEGSGGRSAGLARTCVDSKSTPGPRYLHDGSNDFVLGLARRGACQPLGAVGGGSGGGGVCEVGQASLTSISSRLSCCPIQRSTFFLLLSCISPANSSSSRMK